MVQNKMKIEKFEDLDSWKVSRELTKEIYSLTKKEKFSKDFGLRDQIQRASVSIMANIAEGFDSRSDKAFINFLNYAYRSATEVQSLLYVASDQKYISDAEFDNIYSEIKKIHGLIGGLIKYLKTSK